MLLVLLACAASLGGWLVLGPAFPRRASTVAEASIDIDTPAGRARRDAALALARSAGDPAHPHPPASVASGGGDADDRARCGEDQQAVVATPAPEADGMIHLGMPVPDPDGIVRRLPGETRPAGVGYTGAMRRIDAALRSSADPFDRAMADWLDLDQITPPPARLDALVQDALAGTDARVYGLAYQSCHDSARLAFGGVSAPAPSCARLSAATWVRLDPGNGVPWLFVLDQADRSGDIAAQRDALQGLAASARFDNHDFAGAAAVASLDMQRDADLTAQTVAAMQASAISFPPFSALTRRCRNVADGDTDLATPCARIAETLFDHSDTFISRNIGGAVHRLLTGDASWLDRGHQDQQLVTARWNQPPDASPCGGERGLLEHFVRLDRVGEMGLLEEARRAASAPFDPASKSQAEAALRR